jgi:predicted transcriptional regulator
MNPVVSITLLRDECQVDFSTAKKTITALVQAGLAREVTGQRRNRLWVATDILNLISEKRTAAQAE